MRKNKSANVALILRTSSGSLSGTLAQVERLQRLNLVLSRQLDPDIASHCQAGNLRGDTLVVHTDNAAWATKLRFLAPQLLRDLRHERGLSRLARVEVRVIPPSPVSPRPAAVANPISETSREHLRAAAKSLQDPRLQAALERLAKP